MDPDAVRFVEFDAVLLALDDRSNLHPVSETVPLPAMPLGNVPLVVFPLYQIAQAGFESCIVVVSQSAHAAVSAALRHVMDDIPMKIRVEHVPNNIGSAEGTSAACAMGHHHHSR